MKKRVDFFRNLRFCTLVIPGLTGNPCKNDWISAFAEMTYRWYVSFRKCLALNALIFMMGCINLCAMEYADPNKILVQLYVNSNSDKSFEIPDLTTIENNIVECDLSDVLSKKSESSISLQSLKAEGFIKSILLPAEICRQNSEILHKNLARYQPFAGGGWDCSSLTLNWTTTLLALNELLLAYETIDFATAFFITLSFIIDMPTDIRITGKLRYNMNQDQPLKGTIKILIKNTLKKRLGFSPYEEIETNAFNKKLFDTFTDLDLITCAIGEVHYLFNIIPFKISLP